jgi:hypothetical protein
MASTGIEKDKIMRLIRASVNVLVLLAIPIWILPLLIYDLVTDFTFFDKRVLNGENKSVFRGEKWIWK